MSETWAPDIEPLVKSNGSGRPRRNPNNPWERSTGQPQVIYRGGDYYRLNDSFDNPDYTDMWPEPEVGDDLSLVSGRYPRSLESLGGRPGSGFKPQRLSDRYVLEARKERLEMMEGIERTLQEESNIKAIAADSAYKAMEASCVNEGQKAILKKMRREIISYIYQNGQGYDPLSDMGPDPFEEVTDPTGVSDDSEMMEEEQDIGVSIPLDSFMNFFSDKANRIERMG